MRTGYSWILSKGSAPEASVFQRVQASKQVRNPVVIQPPWPERDIIHKKEEFRGH